MASPVGLSQVLDRADLGDEHGRSEHRGKSVIVRKTYRESIELVDYLLKIAASGFFGREPDVLE
jgi:hypothetical protein